MTIHTFNTGRMYSKDGQRIAYTEISRTPDEDNEGTSLDLEWVTLAFYDVDRGIYGTIKLVGFVELHEQPTPAGLLRAYDCGSYCPGLSDYALEKRLRDAAEGAIPFLPSQF